PERTACPQCQSPLRGTGRTPSETPGRSLLQPPGHLPETQLIPAARYEDILQPLILLLCTALSQGVQPGHQSVVGILVLLAGITPYPFAVEGVVRRAGHLGQPGADLGIA